MAGHRVDVDVVDPPLRAEPDGREAEGDIRLAAVQHAEEVGGDERGQRRRPSLAADVHAQRQRDHATTRRVVEDRDAHERQQTAVVRREEAHRRIEHADAHLGRRRRATGRQRQGVLLPCPVSRERLAAGDDLRATRQLPAVHRALERAARSEDVVGVVEPARERVLDRLGRTTVQPDVETVGRGGRGHGAQRESGDRAGHCAAQK